MNARRTEAVRQQAIVAALFAPDRAAALEAVAAAGVSGTAEALARGLGAYRGNGHATAERALRAVYPVTVELLGASAASAAVHLWCVAPPRSGDLAEWGGAFADWLATQPSLAAHPQWVGCARIEWARHRAAVAADAVLDTASLALLGSQQASVLRLRLKPGVTLVRGAPGFYETWSGQACGGDTSGADATPPVADSEAVVVWRDGFTPRVLPIDTAWCAWLASLEAGATLHESLAILPGPDLETALRRLITHGWLLDVVNTHAISPHLITDEDPA